MGNHLRRSVLVLVVVLGTAVLLHGLWAVGSSDRSWYDMTLLFGIIGDWWDGEAPLYPTLERARQEPGFPSFRYPPVWAVSMMPLIAVFPARVAVAMWGVISLLLCIGALLIALRRLSGARFPPALALFVLALSGYGPLYESFNGPTKELSTIGLIVIAFLVQSRRPGLAGFCLAAAGALKVYPLAFGFYFLMRGRLRLLLWGGVWFVLINLAPLPWIGVTDTLYFYLEVLPNVGGSFAHPENVSIELLLMLGHWWSWFDRGLAPLDPTQFAHGLATLWRVLAAGGATLLGLVGRRRGWWDDPHADFLFFGTWVAICTVSMPVSWVGYQIYFTIPLVGLIAWGVTRRSGRRLIAPGILMLLTLVLVSTPLHDRLLRRYVDPSLSPALSLSWTIGEGLWDELAGRIADRGAQLAAVDVPATLGAADAADTRRWLRARDIPGPRDVAADLNQARLDLERARQNATGAINPRWVAILARDEARLRAKRLSTRTLLLLTSLRAVAGLLALLAAAVGCVLAGLSASGVAPPTQSGASETFSKRIGPSTGVRLTPSDSIG